MSECALMDKSADEARRALVLRLKRVEGQLRGIQSMIESGADCEEIALQQKLPFVHLVESGGGDLLNYTVESFSQGGALALYAGLRHPVRLAGLISLSAYVIDPSSLPAEAAAANRDVPIFMAHGSEDDVVQYHWGEASRLLLERLNGRQDDFCEVVLPVELVVRGSSGEKLSPCSAGATSFRKRSYTAASSCAWCMPVGREPRR